MNAKASGLTWCPKCSVIKERDHRDCRTHKSKRYQADLATRYSNYAYQTAVSEREAWRARVLGGAR